VKNALVKRFKKEHIARLGNNHVIYPTMSKSSYRTLIQKYLNNITKVCLQRGYIINFEDSIVDYVYNNGVFPTQGVRPVLSTISSHIDSKIPNIYSEFSAGEAINVYYKSGLVFKTVDKEVKFDIDCDLDYFRNKFYNNSNLRITHAVHESAHALVSYILRGEAPDLIMARHTHSEDSFGGFVASDPKLEDLSDLYNAISVAYAGTVAEKMIFGNYSSGAGSDIEKATSIANHIIKDLGYYKIRSGTSSTSVHVSSESIMTSQELEVVKLLNMSKNNVEILLDKYKKQLLKLSNIVYEEIVVDKDRFYDIFSVDDMKIELNVPPNKLQTFNEQLKEFL
jgi:cell division protease FtsH